MKPFLLCVIGIFLVLPLLVNAETKEEEMARMQEILNRRTLGIDKPEPAPPVVIAAPISSAKPEINSAKATSGGALSRSIFTGYRLAGVTLGMAESDVTAKLQAEGYACNMAQAQAMMQMTGRSMCVYISSESPKIAMFTIRGGQLRDFELHETYKTGFPEEVFNRIKQKFMGSYGAQAKCKTKRRGEICEVFGHGYRIVLRSKIRDDEAKIIQSFHTM